MADRHARLSRRSALGLVALTAAPAADVVTDDQTTNGAVNGRSWDRMSLNERIYFISGFNGAVVKLLLLAAEQLKSDECVSSIYTLASNSLSAEKFVLNEISAKVTKLYSEDVGNLIIPIYEVLALALQSLNGAESATIESAIENRRRYYINSSRPHGV